MLKLSTIQSSGTDGTLPNWTFHGGAPTDLNDVEGPVGFWWKKEPVRDIYGAIAAICKAGGQAVANGIEETEVQSQVLTAIQELISSAVREAIAPLAPTTSVPVYVADVATGDGKGRDASNRMSSSDFAKLAKEPVAARYDVYVDGGVFTGNLSFSGAASWDFNSPGIDVSGDLSASLGANVKSLFSSTAGGNVTLALSSSIFIQGSFSCAEVYISRNSILTTGEITADEFVVTEGSTYVQAGTTGGNLSASLSVFNSSRFVDMLGGIDITGNVVASGISLVRNPLGSVTGSKTALESSIIDIP